MKQFFSGMLITLALVLAIVVGVVAIAESAETEAPQLPATEQAPAETAPEAEAPSTESTDSTALKEALDAYNAARQSSKVEGLEAELKGYVESGKLTQEQADLILNYYKEQESLRNGTCPNCGYQFQSQGGFGRGGRSGGGKGGRGGMGGNGGMRGFGRQGMGAQDNAQGNAPTDGMAFDGSAQVAPDAFGFEGI